MILPLGRTAQIRCFFHAFWKVQPTLSQSLFPSRLKYCELSMPEPVPCYPPNPERLPAGLTELNWSYFGRALLVLVTLILFVAVYLGLLVGSGYLCYASFMALKEPLVSSTAPSVSGTELEATSNRERIGRREVAVRRRCWPSSA